jgi:hypothetical protein
MGSRGAHISLELPERSESNACIDEFIEARDEVEHQGQSLPNLIPRPSMAIHQAMSNILSVPKPISHILSELGIEDYLTG